MTVTVVGTSNGATIYHITAGQTNSGDLIFSGGNEIVDSGGATIDALVYSNGAIFVSGGGTASGTILSGGDLAAWQTGATVVGTIISSGCVVRVGWYASSVESFVRNARH